jgi:Domain of unknown function (DUF4252)
MRCSQRPEFLDLQNLFFMKQYFFLAALLLAFAQNLGAQTTGTSASAIDKYFSAYVDDKRFSVVYISPKLFQMLGKIDNDIFDMKDEQEARVVLDLAKDLQGLRILSTDVTPELFYKEARAKINTKEYEVLLTVRDKDGDDVEFFVKETNNIISELLLISKGDDEFSLLSFMGALDLNKITRLAKEIEKHDD